MVIYKEKLSYDPLSFFKITHPFHHQKDGTSGAFHKWAFFTFMLIQTTSVFMGIISHNKLRHRNAGYCRKRTKRVT